MPDISPPGLEQRLRFGARRLTWIKDVVQAVAFTGAWLRAISSPGRAGHRRSHPLREECYTLACDAEGVTWMQTRVDPRGCRLTALVGSTCVGLGKSAGDRRR